MHLRHCSLILSLLLGFTAVDAAAGAKTAAPPGAEVRVAVVGGLVLSGIWPTAHDASGHTAWPNICSADAARPSWSASTGPPAPQGVLLTTEN